MRAQTRRGSGGFRRRAAFAAVLALVLASSATGAEQQSSQADTPVIGSGLQVGFDPETGTFRAPTPAEAQVLTAQPRRPAAPVQQMEWPDGTVAVNVEGLFMNYFVVRLGEHGVGAACVDGEEAGTSLAHDLTGPALEER